MIIKDNYNFEFTVIARAVYFPGNITIKERLTEIDLEFDKGNSSFVNGFIVMAASPLDKRTSGTITLNFTDENDGAILQWFHDWDDKMTRFNFRKDDLIAEGKLTLFNSSKQLVNEFTLNSLQPIKYINEINYSDDSQKLAKRSILLKFEDHKINVKSF